MKMKISNILLVIIIIISFKILSKTQDKQKLYELHQNTELGAREMAQQLGALQLLQRP